MVEKTEKSPKKKRFELIETPIEYGPAFFDNDSDETISQLELLKRIANDLDELKKQLI